MLRAGVEKHNRDFQTAKPYKKGVEDHEEKE
jgi:hypothetical protein